MMRTCYTMSKSGRRYNMNTAHRGMNPFYVPKPAKVYNRPVVAVSSSVEASASVVPVRSFWSLLWCRIKAFFAFIKKSFVVCLHLFLTRFSRLSRSSVQSFSSPSAPSRVLIPMKSRISRIKSVPQESKGTAFRGPKPKLNSKTSRL